MGAYAEWAWYFSEDIKKWNARNRLPLEVKIYGLGVIVWCDGCDLTIIIKPRSTFAEHEHYIYEIGLMKECSIDTYNMSYKGLYIYGVFCASMGVYGCSRGYRSQHYEEVYDELTTDRITLSLLNGIIYATPGFNIVSFVRLLNRLEIQHKKLDKNKYKLNYKEVHGICYDTL